LNIIATIHLIIHPGFIDMWFTVILIIACGAIIGLTFGTLRERFADMPANAETSFYDFHDELADYAAKIERAVAASFSDSMDPESDAVRFFNKKAADNELRPYNWKRYRVDRAPIKELIGEPIEYMDLVILLRIIVEEQLLMSSQLLEGFVVPDDCCAERKKELEKAQFEAAWSAAKPKIDTDEYRGALNAVKAGIEKMEQIKRAADGGSEAVINQYAPDARAAV
jgi:hypothetical protein